MPRKINRVSTSRSGKASSSARPRSWLAWALTCWLAMSVPPSSIPR